MLQFRLKNGQVVKVKPEHLDKFKEKYPDAVAVGDSGGTDEELLTGNFQNDAAEGAATVSGPKQEAPEDTEYKPENILSESPEPKQEAAGESYAEYKKRRLKTLENEALYATDQARQKKKEGEVVVEPADLDEVFKVLQGREEKPHVMSDDTRNEIIASYKKNKSAADLTDLGTINFDNKESIDAVKEEAQKDFLKNSSQMNKVIIPRAIGKANQQMVDIKAKLMEKYNLNDPKNITQENIDFYKEEAQAKYNMLVNSSIKSDKDFGNLVEDFQTVLSEQTGYDYDMFTRAKDWEFGYKLEMATGAQGNSLVRAGMNYFRKAVIATKRVKPGLDEAGAFGSIQLTEKYKNNVLEYEKEAMKRYLGSRDSEGKFQVDTEQKGRWTTPDKNVTGAFKFTPDVNGKLSVQPGDQYGTYKEYLEQVTKHSSEAIEKDKKTLLEVAEKNLISQAYKDDSFDKLVKGEDVLFNAAGMAGEQLPNMAIAMLTMGIGNGIQMGSDMYVEGVKNKVKQQFNLSDQDTITPAMLQEVLKDEEWAEGMVTKAVAGGTLAGSLERFGAGKVLTNFTKGKAKSILRGGLVNFAKRSGAVAVNQFNNGATEAITEILQEIISAGVSGGDTNQDELFRAGGTGFITSIFTGGARNLSKQIKTEVQSVARIMAGKLDSNSSEAYFNSTIREFDAMIKEENNPASKQELIDKRDAVVEVRNANAKIPKKYTNENRNKVIDLMVEAESLRKEMEGKDDALIGDEKERLKNIIEQLQAVERKQAFEDQLKTGKDLTSKLGFENEPNVSNDTESFLQSIADDLYEGDIEVARKEVGDSNGVFAGKGRIYINKAQALENKTPGTIGHEVLHPILNAAIGDIEAQKAILPEFKKLLSKEQMSWVQEQLDNSVDPANQDAEFITYFAEGIQSGAIKYDENTFQKIGRVIKQFIERFTGAEILDFTDGKDVFKFIKNYNISMKEGKGKISGSVVENIKAAEAKTGLKASEVDAIDGDVSKSNVNQLNRLQEELENLDEADFDFDDDAFNAAKSNIELKIRKLKSQSAKPKVKVSRPTEVDPVAKKIKEKAEVEKKKDYNNEELISKIKDKATSEKDKRAAEKELTDSFDAMALDAIKYDKSKGDMDMVEVRDYLRQFLPSLIEKYDPSKAKFSTMVYTNMGPKAQQTYQRFLKIADKSLDVAAGETGSVKEIAAQETSTTQTVSEKKTRTIDPVKLMGGPEVQAKYTKGVRKAIESGDIDLDGLTFGNLTDLAPEVTAELFDIPLLKVTDPADNLTKKDVVVDAGNIDKIKKYYPDAKPGMVIPSEAGKIRNWLKRNITEFRAILPSENVAPELATFDAAAYVFVKGTGLKIPPSLLKSLYEPTGQRSKGKTSQVAIKKLKNLSDTQVLELFGIVKGQEAKYDRVIGQRLKGVATLIGKLATNAEVRKIENISDIAIQNIAAGKSSVMFSKITIKDKNNIKTALESKSLGNNLSNDVVGQIVRGINDVNDIKGLMKLINTSVKNTLGVRGRRELEIKLLSIVAKSTNFASVIKQFQKEYRKLYKYEYGVVGYSYVRSKLAENIKNAKDRDEKIQIIKDFLLYESRSIRTGKVDGITTNRDIFNNILKEFDAKGLGFTLVERNGRTYIHHNKVRLQGLMDITYIKTGGFTESTIDQMNKEADQTLDYLMKSIENVDADVSTGYLALSSIDQRGILRKLSRPGFGVKGVEGKMILEHETEALSIHNKIMEFVNGDINKTELTNFIKDSKVNLLPSSLDKVLNEDSSLRDGDRYQRQEFKDAFNKLMSQDGVRYNGNLSFSGVKINGETEADIESKLSKQFNRIIQNATGIDAKEVYSKDKASVEGANKGRFKFFIPPSAEDFVGLLYATLGKGKLGDAQMAWYKKHVIDTYSRAMNNVTNDRVRLGKAFKEIKNQFKTVPSDLKGKVKGTNFTKEHAVRAWIWTQLGEEIPGFTEADIKPLVDFINSNEDVKAFAEQVMKLNPGFGYAKPEEGWTAGTISTDMISVINDSNRKGHLELWQQNVDQIFSKENLNKLEAAYGVSYRKAMENVLARMKAGKNRIFATDTAMGRWTEWLNGSVGAIMFFNTRSAVLQTISSINFMNWSDNNPLMAAKAFANLPQWSKDFKKLFNSEFLLDRRDGLKINVSESEIADIAKNQGVRGLMARLLKVGFTPTQIADSFAIASGGASFYRNRINTYIKDGMDPIAAEKQAMIDFRENAEESQQSSRPDKISQQQAGGLGRVILAFANTPSQYARIMKKAAQDLKNGRGDAKTNISKILYYGALQNLLFTTLQNAAFGLIFGDEEDDDKVVNMANGAADTLLRGTGVYGAIVSTVKNALLEIYKQQAKERPDYDKVVLQVARISPPLGSKLQKAMSATNTFSKKGEEIKEMGYDIDNPAYMAAANSISALTNVPTDRLLKKINNLKAMTGKDVSDMQRLALLAGWSEADLGIAEWQKEQEEEAKAKSRSTGVKRKRVERKRITRIK
jgi:hypothetical protein